MVVMMAGWFGLGATLGWLSILTQKWTVSQIEPGRGAVFAVSFALGVVLRWIAAVALLFIAFQSDFLTGLAAFSGFLIARWWALVYLTKRI